MSACRRCNGFIGEPGKAYGYVGPWCKCLQPLDPVHAGLDLAEKIKMATPVQAPGTLAEFAPLTSEQFVFWLRGFAALGTLDARIKAQLERVTPK